MRIIPGKDQEVKPGYSNSEKITVSRGKDFLTIEEEDGGFRINDARAEVSLRIIFNAGISVE